MPHLPNMDVGIENFGYPSKCGCATTGTAERK